MLTDSRLSMPEQLRTQKSERRTQKTSQIYVPFSITILNARGSEIRTRRNVTYTKTSTTVTLGN